MTPEELIKDPGFHALPDSDKLIIFGQADPEFAKLPANDQITILSGFSKAPPAPQAAPADPMAESLGMFQPGNMQAPPADQLQGLPGQFVQGMVEQLPIAGMIGGGALGAPAGPLGAVGGAGMGGAIGAGARGAIQSAMGWRTPPTLPGAMAEMGKEGAYGLMGEMGGPLLAKGIQKVTSPFAKSTAAKIAGDESIAAAQKLVEHEGAQISPNVINPSRTSNFFTKLTEKIWPASSIMGKRRGTLQGLANKLESEFVTSRSLYDSSGGAVNNLWENWVNLAGGKEATYYMPKTLEVLKEVRGYPATLLSSKRQLLKGKQPYSSTSFWRKDAATFQKELEDTGQVSIQSIRDIMTTAMPASVKGADSTARRKLLDNVMADLGSSGNTEMVQALSKAREVGRLNRIAGPLREIFTDSTILPTRPGEVPSFNPATFTNLWSKKRGDFITNPNYSEADIKVIDAFANKMKALVPDLEKAAKLTPAYSLQGMGQFNLQNPLGVAAAIYKFPVLAVPVGLDAGLAMSLMNPNGVMRKFLTTGFKPPTLSPKVGIMSGLEAAND